MPNMLLIKSLCNLEDTGNENFRTSTPPRLWYSQKKRTFCSTGSKQIASTLGLWQSIRLVRGDHSNELPRLQRFRAANLLY
jgi:hypothetical protein